MKLAVLHIKRRAVSAALLVTGGDVHPDRRSDI